MFDVARRMWKKHRRCIALKVAAAASGSSVFNAGFYQVLSAEVGTKHGLNVSGLVLDEVHARLTGNCTTC